MLNNKKILYIVTQTKWGGAQKYVLDLAAYFSKKNDVSIAFGQAEGLDNRFMEQCRMLGIKTHSLKYLQRDIDLGRDFLAMREVLDLLNKEKYNLVHLNSSKVGLLGSISSLIYGLNPYNLKLRIVYTAHGFVFNEPLTKMRRSIYRLSESLSTSMQSLIITVSDYDKESAAKNKVGNPRRMFTVHNGIDAGVYSFPDKTEARKRLKLDDEYKYFGTIASFYPTKGHLYLIDAIELLAKEGSALLNNYRWVFIGDGPELYKIKSLAKEKAVEKYIIFAAPDNQDWKNMTAFDAFILPSVKEGLPYTILEAGLANIPVIASRVGGIPEILTDYQSGLLTAPANPLSLANAIKKIASDEDLASTLAKENHENVKKNFSLRSMLQKTEDLYQKLF